MQVWNSYQQKFVVGPFLKRETLYWPRLTCVGVSKWRTMKSKWLLLGWDWATCSESLWLSNNTVRTLQQQYNSWHQDHAQSTCANITNTLKRLTVWHWKSYARRIPVQTWQDIQCYCNYLSKQINLNHSTKALIVNIVCTYRLYVQQNT